MMKKRETLCEKKLRLTQEDLADLERHLEELFIFLPFPFCALNPVGSILEINQALKELTGYDTDELVGKRLDFLFPDLKLKTFFEKLSKRKEIRNEELTLISKQKKEIPVSLFVSRKEDRGGNLIGYFVAMMDLSSIKKIQKELQRKIRDLEKLQRISVGRELKMIELKKEIKNLKKELEKYKGRK